MFTPITGMGITDRAIRFRMKDSDDHGRNKIIELAQVEFLRRFFLNILQKVFVKIRYYGICSAAWQQLIELPPAETSPERPETSTG